MTDKTERTPMDAGAPEKQEGTPSTNSPRACYAIKTLVKEFRDLFPETATALSNYDGRNTALSVTFDLTSLPEDARIDATNLMMLLNDPAYNEDQRIDYVLVEDEQALVTMRASARTQDSREPFGLADAYEVLVGNDEGYDTEDDETEDGVFGDPLSHPGSLAARGTQHSPTWFGGSL